MEKYKVSFLPTSRSRKMKSFFIYAAFDGEAIQNADDEINRRFPGGKVVSVQGPDHGFVNLKRGTK